MTKKLIVNADGFGFTFGANRGVREAIRGGIVTSVSCNTNFPAIEEVPDLAREFPTLSIGVHVNLNVGRPVLPAAEIPTLVDAEGNFMGRRFARQVMLGRVRRGEMEEELDAQIDRMIRLGVQPTHWDGHQDMHLYPPYLFAAMKVAKRRGIRCMRSHRRYIVCEDGLVRWSRLVRHYAGNPRRLARHVGCRLANATARLRGFKTADHQISAGYLDASANFRLSTWIAVMRFLPEGVSEIVCHPAYPDDMLRAHAVYVDERRQELEALTSEQVRRAVEDNGVQLMSYFDL